MFFANSFSNKKFITDLLRVGNTGDEILRILDCISSDFAEFKRSQTESQRLVESSYQLTEPQFWSLPLGSYDSLDVVFITTLFYNHTHSFDSMSTLSNLLQGAFFQSIFQGCDNYVSSSSITSVHVDVITGTVAVLYNNDRMYRYENVSRKAILTFVLDKSRSLGRFVNTYCKSADVKWMELANMTPNYVLGASAW